MALKITRLFSITGFFISLMLIQHDANAANIDELEKKIDILQEQLQQMKNQLETVEVEQSSIKSQQGKSTNVASIKTGEKFKVSTKGGIKVESTGGNFKAQLGGRILTDFAWYDEDRSDLGEGTEFRATRLFLAGTLFKDWHFKGQYEFSDNVSAPRDVFISYTGFNPFYIKVGHYKPPFSMEQLTSLRFITFLERGLSDNFVPGRLLGVSAGSNGENWGATLGAFGSTAGGDVPSEGNENWSAIGRVSYAPIYNSTSLLHLGLSGRYLVANDEAVQFRARPSSNVTDARFVDTGSLANVDTTVSLNAELATVWGPLSFQGQYVQLSVERDNQSSDLDFNGWYVFGSYFLTGESRNYNVQNGAFGRITPKNRFNLNNDGWGAWELIARFDTLDLNDEDILGGEERNITVGLNWYPNSRIRVLTNYVLVNNDAFATGNAANLLSGETTAGDDDPNIFQFRVQADF